MDINQTLKALATLKEQLDQTVNLPLAQKLDKKAIILSSINEVEVSIVEWLTDNIPADLLVEAASAVDPDREQLFLLDLD